MPAIARGSRAFPSEPTGGWASQQSTWDDPDNWVDNFSFDFNTSNVSRTRSGVTLGAEAGYTWQTHCTVFGVSVDGNWADIGDSKTFSPAPGGTQLTFSDNLNGTARCKRAPASLSTT